MTVYCDSPAVLRLETLDSFHAVTASLDLMDQANGYRVNSLDVGFPTVRDITAALPTRDGEYDMTRLYGPRAVTIAGTFVPSAAGGRQNAMQQLAWWCQPALRPRLVYQVDDDSPTLWIGLRGSQMSGPHSNPYVTAFTASWVATDPVARAMTSSTLTLNPSTAGTVTNHGSYKAWPVLVFWGPCTNPSVMWTTPAAGGVYTTGLTVASGHNIAVDTNAQTVILDGNPAASYYPNLDFANTRWAALEPGNTTIYYTCATSSSPAHCVVTWADATI